MKGIVMSGLQILVVNDLDLQIQTSGNREHFLIVRLLQDEGHNQTLFPSSLNYY